MNRLAAAGVDLVAPLECAGCGVPGVRWCPRCAGELGATARPVRVRAEVPVPVWALAPYAGAVAAAVSAYKDRGRVDLAEPLGRALAAALDGAQAAGHLPEAGSAPLVLVPFPASRAARRRRGFDHVRALVGAVAADLTGGDPPQPVTVAPLLELRGRVRDSTGLGAQARLDNLAGRVHRRGAGTRLVAGAGAPATLAEVLAGPASVVVVDDVVTTGASVAAGVAALTAGGLRVAGALALCHA